MKIKFQKGVDSTPPETKEAGTVGAHFAVEETEERLTCPTKDTQIVSHRYEIQNQAVWEPLHKNLCYTCAQNTVLSDCGKAWRSTPQADRQATTQTNKTD